MMLSVILLSYFSEKRIEKVHTSLSNLLGKEGIPFELIIMDDGSTDQSFEVASKLAQAHPSNVRAYRLSKNYTSAYSIYAGISLAKGACAMAIPDDEQLPYEVLVRCYREWQKGSKIIIPYRTERDDPILMSLWSNSFYYLINRLSNIKYPPGGADLFFVDREVIDVLNEKIRPLNTYPLVEILKVGYSPSYLPFVRPKSSSAKSRWSFSKKLRLASDILFSSSTSLIRLITLIGICSSIFSGLLILFYFWMFFFSDPILWGYKVPGWTSTICFITFFSGFILLSLGIIAEYIWRIYDEVKDRPPYLIRKD